MSAFSSVETNSLYRQIDSDEQTDLSLHEIWNDAQLNVCVEWIKQNGYKKICLQFPDIYLPYSVTISDSIKTAADEIKLFILADTSYGSCCVDEVAAAHVEADSLIHFGNACRSKVLRLPVLYIFPELSLSQSQLLEGLRTINEVTKEKSIQLYFDIGYHHVLKQSTHELPSLLKQILQTDVINLHVYPSTEIYRNDLKSEICIFVGKDNSRFSTLSLNTDGAPRWFIYDPTLNKIYERNPLTANFIKRRYFYIEKCKDAQKLGLIVATLSTDGYLQVIEHIQHMAIKRGIKTQIISVGRINSSKLANFLDIDCFVLIGCPFNNLYTSKEFYKPIVSVFEVEMALNPAWHMKYPEVYVSDFKELLPEGYNFVAFNPELIEENDISLVSGRIRHGASSTKSKIYPQNEQTILEHKNEMKLLDSFNLTLETRSWKGLDPALGSTDPAKLQNGLSGIPINYTHN